MMTMNTQSGLRMLVVDDEPSRLEAVSTSLRYEGFSIDEPSTGRQSFALSQGSAPDLVVLDLMLPDLDGLDVTRRLRSEGIRVPVILSTARGTLQDKVAGLTVGGDDYLTKPFALAEVIARVRSLLRSTGLEDNDDGFPRFADIEMDETAHEVRRAGTTVQLTATEFNLLRYFLLNPRCVLSKTPMLDHVWDYGFEGGGRVVESYVSYVRTKLERYGLPVIHAVRLVGRAQREPCSDALALAS
jgi:two-component system OmpR family response regulator